mmetsp:Transcript_13675/g.26170  ORF Transcript_13675/g.26170 Transcript_13675/m.26170 type:complete len:2110 (+) Transcript_13675:171-6500(+)
MFSSFSQSFSQLSPKKLLANYLSNQLAEFLDCDPNTIETNLVTDAHIKLQNIRIHPYVLESNKEDLLPLVCEGRIEEFEFSWKWGTGFGEGAQAYIKDVQVRVRGVQMRVYASVNPPPPKKPTATRNRSTTTTTPTLASPMASESGGAGDPDWKARYLQQIVDHISLVLESLEISIELPNQEGNLQRSMYVVGKKMELTTLGGSSSSTTTQPAADGLRQRLSLGSLSAVIRQTGLSGGTTTQKEFPLLDPVGYRAMIKRVSGRRFVDGIGAGLVISGESILSGMGTNATGVVGNALQVHAGIVQVGCLLQLQKMFGFDDAPANDSSAADFSEEDENKSSLFVLPVDYMSLTLQNGTNLRINQSVLTLRTDGSVCRCDSPKGSLWVDGDSVNHTEAGTWQVDLLRSRITVDSHPSTTQDGESETYFDASQDDFETLTNFELHVDQCRKIYQGLNEIMPLFDDTDAEDTVTPWTFEVKGNAGISLVSSNGTKARVNLSHPRLRYIGSSKNGPGSLPGLPCLFSWDSINVHSPDLGNLSAFIPKVEASSDGLALTFSEAITANIESADSLQDAIDVVNEFLNVMEGESTGVPVRLAMPTVTLQLRNEEMNVGLQNVVVMGFAVSIVESTGFSGQGSFSARGLQCDTSSNTINLDVLSFSSSDDSISLVEPLENVRVQLVEERLVIKVGPAKAMVRQSSQSKEDSTPLWDVLLPMGLELSLKGLTVYENEASRVLVQLTSTEVKAIPLDGQCTLDLEWDCLEYEGFELSKGSARLLLSKDLLDASVEVSSLRSTAWPIGRVSGEGVKLTGRLKATHSSAEAFPIDGIGYVDELSLSIRSVSDLRVDGSFSLTEPISDTTLRLSRGKVVVEMGKVVIMLPESSNSITEDGGLPSSPDFRVPLAVEFSLPEVTVYRGNSNKLLEARSCSAWAYSAGDQTGIDFTWELLTTMSFNLRAGKASLSLGLGQVDGSIALESVASVDWPDGILAAKGFRAKAILESSRSSENSFQIEGIGFLPMACVSLDEISSFSLTDLVTLAAPVTACSIEFSEGTCAMQLGHLGLVLDIPSKAPDSSLRSGNPPLETSLPFPVICSVPSIAVRYPSGPFDNLRVASALLELKPDGSSTSGKLSCSGCSVDQVSGNGLVAEVLLSESKVWGSLSCDNLRAENYHGVDLSMKSHRCSVEVDFKSVSSESAYGLWVDGVGTVTKATASISEIESLSVDGIGCLVIPLTGTRMLSNKGVVEVSLGDLHWCHSETSVPTQAPTQAKFSMESLLASFELPCPIKMSMHSAKVYTPDEMNPGLQWEQVSLECKTQHQVSEAILTWYKSSLYGVDVGSTAIGISCKGSQIMVKATVASAFLDDTTRASFSVKSMTANMVVETSSEKGVVGFPVDFLGQLIEIETGIEEINSLYVPGSGTLLSPLQKTEFLFHFGTSKIHLDHVYWHDLSASQDQPSEASSLAEYASMFRFPLELFVKIARIDNDPFNSAHNSKQSTFGFKNLLCHVQPVGPSSFLVPFTVSQVEEVWYLQIVQVPSLRLRGIIDIRKPDCVRNLDIDVRKLHLSADFTAMDWSSALTRSQESSPPVPLPNTKISELDLILSGKGKVLAMKSSALHCKAFSGSETTNSESLSKHYVAIVKKRIPYLLSNAEVLGSNFGDSIGISVANVVMNSTIVGSVAGVGARDAVGGALSLGKLSRGASETDRYHLGDFSRGISAAAGLAAKKGASMRGSDKYAVGDFATGATSAAAQYTSKNRERLGGAAGCGTAMMVGAALAGPVGLVTGAVVGGMAGKKVVKATVGEYKRGSGSTNQPSPGSDTNGHPSVTRQLPSSSQTNNPKPSNSPQNQARREAESIDRFSVVPSQETHLSTQQNTTSGNDLLDVFGSPETTQTEQANAISAARQHDTSGMVDPFSLFESQPAQTQGIPSKDPLSMFALQQTPMAPDPGLSYTAAKSHQQNLGIEMQHRQTANGPASASQSHQANPAYLAQQTSATRKMGVSNAPAQQPLQYREVQPRTLPAPSGYAATTTYHVAPANPSQQRNTTQMAAAGNVSTQPPPVHQQHTVVQQAGQGQQAQQQGYKFGDVTRGLIAKGKQKRGTDGNKNYKFGDFSRGLFG